MTIVEMKYKEDPMFWVLHMLEATKVKNMIGIYMCQEIIEMLMGEPLFKNINDL